MSDSNHAKVTQDETGVFARPDASTHVDHLARIGRYRVEKLLGKGGFGLVFLAHDDELDRPVAIKVPHASRVSRPADAEVYRAEARTAANLDHPGIVPVFDVGSTEQCPCYIVSKYVEGSDLAEVLSRRRLRYSESAELIATVAEALHYAHKQGLVHRDVKPGNILIGTDARPYVADFGLALHEQSIGRGTKDAGTTAYMSPEQARGEGHRVDGRSDVFSLGVVFYEMLVGRRPFRGDTPTELLEHVARYEPRPPRQYDERIPKELERICLKALSKRASARYTTARDLADDLRHFLAEQSAIQKETSPSGAAASADTPATTPASAPSAREAHSATASGPAHSTDHQPLKIVPKGLHAFDAHDADFFLELLPGPRDRHGLPDSLRFWKARIEEMDADDTFSVGLIYGPSGCGKSSLVKAGLLPRLCDDIITVYIEATAAETETRLLQGLRKRCPALDEQWNLRETVAAVRRGQGVPVGKKVLIVLDQFEQWLHSNKEEADTELVQALRQCDGGRVQCVVMVRDDFWLAVSRFFRELETRLVEGDNIALVDLFDRDHARRILTAYGRAFGKLPDDPKETTKEQREFLKQSVAGLAEEGKVVCVRLALFAEMMKGKPWSVRTLKEIGGTHGVGVTFLEEIFTSPAASPEHRYHQKAARAVLRSLLPERGADIKGQMKSFDELSSASGYASRSNDFNELIRILDSELRLITPTDPEGVEGDDAPPSGANAGQKYYQLTHDYLVHSLKVWLTRKQKETRRGRAELRLAERSAQWNAKPENRQLPSWWEYLIIRMFTSKKDWTTPQRLMLSKAMRVHGIRWGVTLAVLLATAVLIQQYLVFNRQRNLVDRLDTAVESLANATRHNVPHAIAALHVFPREMVLDKLETKYAAAESSQKLALAYGLADYKEVKLDYLLTRVADAPNHDCANMAAAISNDESNALPRLLELVDQASANEDWRLNGRLAMLAWHLGNATVLADIHRNDRPDPTPQTVFIHDVFPVWHGDLQQIANQLAGIDNAALRSGICLAMGNLTELGDARGTWHGLMLKWHREAPDAGTHSASGWALKQWHVDMPEMPVDTRYPAGLAWRPTAYSFTMLHIPGGSFERTENQFIQKVMLSRGFWLSDREVSVELFQRFIADVNYEGRKPDWDGASEKYSPTDQHPVQQVSWGDAVLFCNWLSTQEGLAPYYHIASLQDANDDARLEVEIQPNGTGYRLPTEAEWEYACRADATTAFCFGDKDKQLEDYAVYDSSNTEIPGSKMCNRWGLFDMHGNVWEWCWDRYGPYVDSLSRDPAGASNGLERVFRGGGFGFHAGICRSWHRDKQQPTYRSWDLGFRVALNPSQ